MSVLQQRHPALLPTQPLESHETPHAGPSRSLLQTQVVAPTPRRAVRPARARAPSASGSDYAASEASNGSDEYVPSEVSDLVEVSAEHVKEEKVEKPVSPASSSRANTTPSRPPSRTERRFPCTLEGCTKAYFKPARLKEHELSHTGERPHPCPHCDQTYIRASHLTAHMRTHLPASAKAYTCTIDECGKTFWTATHLKRHQELHGNQNSYACEHCTDTFHKAKQLREHIAIAHMPAGTKPFICTHDGCFASFAMKQHLQTHSKTHDPSRYSCSDSSHEPPAPSFPTWSALQAHLRDDHPVTCPHAECRNRQFANTQRLKLHLKVHDQRDADTASRRTEGTGDVIDGEAGGVENKKRKRSVSVAETEGKATKLARMKDGMAGKDFACEEDGCLKRFKSKYALQTHHRTAHGTEEDRKLFACTYEGCGEAYLHNQTLKNHIASRHTSTAASPIPDTTDEHHEQLTVDAVEIGGDDTEGKAPDALLDARRPRFGCPIRAISRDLDAADDCFARFWRAYDIRRHLAGYHGVDLTIDEVRAILAGMSRQGKK